MTQRRRLTGIFSALGFLMLILDSKTAISGAADGVELCLRTVIPALFPFFVVSSVLLQCENASPTLQKQLKYKHNDMEDLENLLKGLPQEAVKLIVVDGVFSMEGDLANLPKIVELKHKYNCSIMVDEAHGIGVFGDHGRGVCDHFGLTDEVDLIMGTFSKSMASIGGFIAADADTINYLRHTCRTYIFSASNTPAATAAALEALHILQQEPERIEKLWDVTRYALKRFREEGFEIGETESPIIPLYIHDVEKTFVAVAKAFEYGVFINPVIPPACAPQDTLVRFALMATHTKDEVERAVNILKKVFVELDIIKE